MPHNRDDRSYKLSIRKALAFAVCCCMILMVVYKAVFVLAHFHHEHNHDGSGGSCTVCTDLAIIKRFFDSLSVVLFRTVLLFHCFPAVICFIKYKEIPIDYHTLIQLKIRLNI